jgi:hypothetical protein
MNVFDYLDEIRVRPGMYLGEPRRLQDLELLMRGYAAARGNNSISEGVPSMTGPFLNWLRLKHSRWELALGWAVAITDHVRVGQEPLEYFFELTDEYRELSPRVVIDAPLQPHHRPTGKRVIIGYGTRMDRPDVIQVERYEPAPLHILRFIYPSRIEEDVLLGDNSVVETTLEDAKTWLADEFELRPSDYTLT